MKRNCIKLLKHHVSFYTFPYEMNIPEAMNITESKRIGGDKELKYFLEESTMDSIYKCYILNLLKINNSENQKMR